MENSQTKSKEFIFIYLMIIAVVYSLVSTAVESSSPLFNNEYPVCQQKLTKGWISDRLVVYILIDVLYLCVTTWRFLGNISVLVLRPNPP